MASGTTRIADVIVPEIFTPYVQQLTAEQSNIIRSGAVAEDPMLDEFLSGGGLTINVPSWNDLDNDEDNVSTDTDTESSPNKIGSAQEIAVRLSRNNSWSAADLASALAGSDPVEAIGNRVASYWTRRLQRATVATMSGVFADNAAAPSGTEHVQNDMTHDVSGTAFTNGVTNFSAEAFVDATLTMGEAMDDLGMLFVHPIVYGRMKKNNLIDFIPDSEGRFTIPTFMDHQVVVDNGLPFADGVYETWLFGAGAIRLGRGSPKVPTEVERSPSKGNGGGIETLYNRTEWVVHPVGYAYVGNAPNGGPSNLATTNNLAAAGSWQRVYSEREQIKVARLITREHA